MKTLSLLSVALFATASLAFAPTATADPTYPMFCGNANESHNDTPENHSQDYTCSTGLWTDCLDTVVGYRPGTIPSQPDCRLCTSYSYHKNETSETEESSGCVTFGG